MATQRLLQRLEFLQDEILDAYESRSTKLENHIELWHYIREEQAILHAARQRHVYKIGMQIVPPLLTTQTKAKQAIEMEIVLKSLNMSPYAKEDWTLQDTSIERWLSQPHYTLKKEAHFVDIEYNDSVENKTRETAWRLIYYQDDMGQWHKVKGDNVDGDGVYYVEHTGVAVYYVHFKELLRKYGTHRTTMFTVKHDGKQINVAVASAHPRGPTIIVEDSSDAEETTTGPSEDTRQEKRSRSVSPRPSTPKRKRRQPRPSAQSVLRRLRGRPSPRSGKQQRKRATDGDKPTIVPPSAGEVGRGSRTVPTGVTGRLRRLVAEARDPPIVVFKGPANALKCFRWRCDRQHKRHFKQVSTSWSWISDKGGGAHVIFSFNDVKQRATFMNIVKIPRTFEYFFGNFDSSG